VRPAAFLDRDGVLNELVTDPIGGLAESPLRVEDVRLVPGAAAAARRLAQAGHLLVCVSNQPAAAKGKVSVAQLQAVHERVLELLASENVTLTGSRLCFHHPEGLVRGLSKPCACRKPAPGMLLDAAGALGLDLPNSWMVGDTDADMAAGRAAGCRTLMICHPGSVHKRLQVMSADLMAPDLADGVNKVVSRQWETVAMNRRRYGARWQDRYENARSDLDTDIRRWGRPRGHPGPRG
jgi:D-glycero-D-manno-heptose 1,7-bisphosphate phosphatase